MGMEYKYLFPFEKVNKSERIIIYGAGELGQAYVKQIQLTGYCEILAMVDRNYRDYNNTLVKVVSPEDICKYTFDKLVIALRVESGVNEIYRILEAYKIPKEKIVCIFERNENVELFEQNKNINAIDDIGLKESESIAILITGGIGDAIIQKKFVQTILEECKRAVIDIYNISNIAFLEYLYSDIPNVKKIIQDLGSRYRNAKEKYGLAITIEACHLIRVDYFAENQFVEKKFITSIHKLIIETKKEKASITTPVHITNLVRMYNGYNCYTGFSYNGAFAITDKKVSIPMTESGEIEFAKYGLKKYVTMNYGNGDCQDGSKIAKMWSKERFEKLIEFLHKNYGEYKIIQIGAGDAQKLAGVDQYFLGKKYEILSYLLKNAQIHIDIEGGMVHLASQLGTKCIVLFGPTVMKYYGYENNINIQAGNCHGCWGIYSDVNRCVRNLVVPECMNAISEILVEEKIDEVFKI